MPSAWEVVLSNIVQNTKIDHDDEPLATYDASCFCWSGTLKSAHVYMDALLTSLPARRSTASCHGCSLVVPGWWWLWHDLFGHVWVRVVPANPVFLLLPGMKVPTYRSRWIPVATNGFEQHSGTAQRLTVQRFSKAILQQDSLN